MKKTLAAAALALAGTAAQAYTVAPANPGPHELDLGFNTATMLSPDYGFTQYGSIALTIGVEAGDAPVLTFNALVRNLVGLGIPLLLLDLDGAQFANVGSAAGSFGSTAVVNGAGSHVSIALTPPTYFQATVGDWFLDGSGVDFGIDLSGLAAGSTFTLTATAVPEPGTWALMLLGLAGMAVLRRRRG